MSLEAGGVPASSVQILTVEKDPDLYRCLEALVRWMWVDHLRSDSRTNTWDNINQATKPLGRLPHHTGNEKAPG